MKKMKHFFVSLLLIFARLALFGDCYKKVRKKGSGDVVISVPSELLWGVFIDGRNASLGAQAYGSRYSEQLEKAMLSVLSMPPELDPLQVYLNVIQLLGTSFRNKSNPVDAEVFPCMDRVPPPYRNRILDGMTRFSDATVLIDGGVRGNNLLAIVTKLFEQYDQERMIADGDEPKLRALVRLLRALAFLHPLSPRNGRSRLLLLQHQLRAMNIAGGTFMYNNNKNIYFDPDEVWTAKLRKGIRMYNLAASSRSNPWASSGHVVKDHLSRFARPFDEALFKCWDEKCVNAGCRGATLD